MTVTPIPEEYPRLMPYLVVNGAESAIAFYQEAFGFSERMRLPAPGDLIGHAELELHGSVLMLADAMPDMGIHAADGGHAGVSMVLYVEDVDAVFDVAVRLGAVEVAPVETKFYGDRAGQLRDPFGIEWSIMTRVEELTGEEIARRSAEMAEEA